MDYKHIHYSHHLQRLTAWRQPARAPGLTLIRMGTLASALTLTLTLSGCGLIDHFTGGSGDGDSHSNGSSKDDPAHYTLQKGNALAKAVINGATIDMSSATVVCTGDDDFAVLTATAGNANIVLNLSHVDSPTVASVNFADVGGHSVSWMPTFPGTASATRKGAVYTAMGTIKDPEDPIAYKLQLTCPGKN